MLVKEIDLKNAIPKIVTELPGPNAKKVIAERGENVPNAIRCSYPVVIRHGEGAIVEDVDGNYFLDWIGGVGVLNVGYSEPTIIEAVKEQLNDYFHAMMNIMTHPGYIELAKTINQLAPLKTTVNKTMFANSGAEGIENAVKIAKSFTGRPNIIVFSGAFHGRTALTMNMTANKAYSYGLGPFADGVYRTEYPYLYRKPNGYTDEEAIDYFIENLKKAFREASPAEHVAAIVLEPIQGEGGFIPAPISWVKKVREICDEHGILLIADEVQTGFGRSGKMFVSDYWKEAGCAPDMIVMAKSIAAGLPLSAVCGSQEIMDGVKPGIIGGTYGGNAVACAAALKVIEKIQKENLTGRALVIGKKCREKFEEWQNRFEQVGDVRGIGSMLGIEFVTDKHSKKPNSELVQKIISETTNKGLLIESAGSFGNVIRFLCPLVATDEQIDFGLFVLEKTIEECIQC